MKNQDPRDGSFEAGCSKSRGFRKWILAAIVVGLVGVLAAATFHKGEMRSTDEDWPVNFAHRGRPLERQRTLWKPSAWLLRVEPGVWSSTFT